MTTPQPNAVPPGAAAAHDGTGQQQTQQRTARTRRRTEDSDSAGEFSAPLHPDVLSCLESVGLADHTIAKTKAYGADDRFPQNMEPMLGKGCIIDAAFGGTPHGHVGARPAVYQGISSKTVQITAQPSEQVRMLNMAIRHGLETKQGAKRPAGERYGERNATVAPHVLHASSDTQEHAAQPLDHVPKIRSPKTVF